MDREKIVKELGALVGAEHVHTDEDSLKFGEGYCRNYAKAFGVYHNPLPIAVVNVHNTQEVSQLDTSVYHAGSLRARRKRRFL